MRFDPRGSYKIYNGLSHLINSRRQTADIDHAPILKGVDKLGMVLCGEGGRTAFGVKFGNQQTVAVPRQPQAAIGIKVVILKLHGILLSVLPVELNYSCKSAAELYPVGATSAQSEIATHCGMHARYQAPL
jgi:hypothetical protein